MNPGRASWAGDFGQNHANETPHPISGVCYTQAMLVTLHVLMIAFLLLGPWLLKRRVVSQFSLPAGLAAAGLLAAVGAEVLRLGLAPLSFGAFESGLLPAPSEENNAMVEGIVVGVLSAFACELARLLLFRFQLPEERSVRSAAVVGIGFGGGVLALVGLIEAVMAGLAMFWKDVRFEDLEELGLGTRAAVRLGLRVYQWWDRSPWGPPQLMFEQGCLLAFHIGLTVMVAAGVGKKRFSLIALAFLVHAGTVATGELIPRYIAYPLGALVVGFIAWRLSRAERNETPVPS